MKKLNSKKLIIFTLFLIAITIICPTIAYAATSSEVNFCDYAGSRRTFQIIGIIINLAKVIVPIIIVITGMIAFANPIITGKSDDVKSSAMKLLKQIIAGFVIFFIPTIIDAAFQLIPDYDDSPLEPCTTCLFDPDGCSIPDTDPDTYTEDTN